MPEPTVIAIRRHRRVYDHRLREQVCQGNLRSIPKVDIPRSTIKSWRRRGSPPVVSLAPDARQLHDLAATIAKLENRVQVLAAVVRILLALVRAAGFTLATHRLPDGAAKAGILRAVASAQVALPLSKILKIIRLSPSRYHAWRGRSVPACDLDDRPSCPRSTPTQLTANEIASIKDMVLDPSNRHMPLGTRADRPTLMADSGIENINAVVNANLLESGLRRVLAQVDVTESNSMIEAFWRSLKHNWLYLNSLDSIERLRCLVAFFVQAHNNQMPHSAFHGHTPDEIYAASAPNLLQELADKKADARQRRLTANRALSCARCTVSPVFSTRLHLQPPAS